MSREVCEEKPYWLGRKRGPQTPEHIAKRIGPHIGRKRSAEACKNIGRSKRGKKRSAEAIERMRQCVLRFWSTPDGRARMLAAHRSPESRERSRQARLRQRFPRKMTVLEEALYNQFKKRRLKFEMHKTMFGRFQPDFVFGDIKLVVEADGYYWHSREDRRQDDQRFNQMARADGWTVWRFAESEILQHPEACGRAVARFVRSH